MNFTVLFNLKYNGHLYQRGDQIELDEATAKPLLKDGVISDEKVPTVTVGNWKQGPQEVKHSEEAEVTPTGDIVGEEKKEEEEKKVEIEEAPKKPETEEINETGEDL